MSRGSNSDGGGCWGIFGFLIIVAIFIKILPWLLGFAALVLIIWLIVRAVKKNKVNAAFEAAAEQEKQAYKIAKSPITRYISTDRCQLALQELKSTPDELKNYSHQEIDTFFMNEWAKMDAIYSDETGQFDADVRDNAFRQMTEILDAIFAKFAKKKRAELIEKQAINEELKAKHKEEIDIAMTVYDKWQDK
ncbi:hypothetical protein [Pseudolactococcus insecticola]|uniref:Uncharacterized protein n=1 Tax=Pseudolactococcus insecticola TaxID=2709158 RepID=A0A6A0B7I6_9LACT|nr:hypothetical protein [Lactococcus insecticola]GFH40428.1 hypothetical protein Hs20B_08260 [Lactococcus insecticola]